MLLSSGIFHQVWSNFLTPSHYRENMPLKWLVLPLSSHFTYSLHHEMKQSCPRVFVPLDQHWENKKSGSNHFEMTKFCPSGFTAQAASIEHTWNGCSQSSHFPNAGQGERRLWERDWMGTRLGTGLKWWPVKGHCPVITLTLTLTTPRTLNKRLITVV